MDYYHNEVFHTLHYMTQTPFPMHCTKPIANRSSLHLALRLFSEKNCSFQYQSGGGFSQLMEESQNGGGMFQI